MFNGLSEGQSGKINLTKIRGGKVMKKMLKSKKGFSLIELLIVVAILAILAAVSINLFGGVLKKQKVKTDEGAASYIQTAIQTYIHETDDDTLKLSGTSKPKFEDALKFLSKKNNLIPLNGDPQGEYGPYLNSEEAKLSQQDKVLKVTIDNDTQSVKCEVIDKGSSPADKNYIVYEP